MFKFSLQELMDFRREKLADREREYLRANQELQAVRRRLEQLQQERGNTVEALRRKQQAGISPGERWIFQNYLDELDTQAFDQGALVRKFEEVALQKRALYITARRDVEVMEKLHADELKGFQYKEYKNEEKMLNDLAIFRFRHSQQ